MTRTPDRTARVLPGEDDPGDVAIARIEQFRRETAELPITRGAH